MVDEAPREFGRAPFEPPGSPREFSRDGSRVAVVKGGDVWVLAYPSGAAQRFASGSIVDAVWMPDSRRLLLRENAGLNTSLSWLDTETGVRQIFYVGPFAMLNPAISPDGRRIAFAGGVSGWDVVEVRIDDGRVRTMPSAGGPSWWPAWAPRGTRYAVALLQDRPAIGDVSVTDDQRGSSRLLAEMDEGDVASVRWAPDGNRLSFTWIVPGRTRLMLSNASGGTTLRVDEGATDSRDGVWSPDGEWLAYRRRFGLDAQIVKTRPGSRMEAQVLQSWPFLSTAGEGRQPVDWSPDGRWILTQGELAGGLFLLSGDGETERRLSARPGQGRPTFGFSRDGRSILYLERNTSATGAPWRLWSIDVATGAERLLTDVPLPPSAGDAAGFSLHPDGTRFLTSIADWPFDLWMLEGFDE